ncbi:NAD/NADP-dependent betaine aldehydedehydrogenase, partial [Striga asiatica]
HSEIKRNPIIFYIPTIFLLPFANICLAYIHPLQNSPSENQMRMPARKGLSLLLLGQKNEDKPMRVAPWTQYQLVDQETNPDLQLAPGKKRLVRRCASFVCFGRATATGPEGPSKPNVGPTENREFRQGSRERDGIKDAAHSVDCTVDGDNNGQIGISRKSSLKRSDIAGAVVDDGSCGNSNKLDSSDVTCETGRRKVQWADAIGGELFEIREFEMSEDGSDDEFDHANEKTCACRIM